MCSCRMGNALIADDWFIRCDSFRAGLAHGFGRASEKSACGLLSLILCVGRLLGYFDFWKNKCGQESPKIYPAECAGPTKNSPFEVKSHYWWRMRKAKVGLLLGVC